MNKCLKMASKYPEKRHTIHNTTRIQKELKPNGKAIPAFEDQTIAQEEPQPESGKRRTLATPYYNTILRQREEIEQLKDDLMSRRYQNVGNLTPRSKTAIMPKINQRLNFDVSRPVFKNLMPININDSLLLPTERTSIRKKYNFTSNSNKPPVPELADFLDPIEPLTHFIQLPELKIEFAPLTYDPMEMFERYIDNSVVEQSYKAIEN